MASNVCTMLETQGSTKLNRHGRKILVVKGTVYTRLRLKEIRAKVTVIDLASFDVGHLKKNLLKEKKKKKKKKKEDEQIQGLAVFWQ